MSIQSKIADFALRGIKRQFRVEVSPEHLRVTINRMAKFLPPVPKHLSVQHELAHDIPCVWVRHRNRTIGRTILYIHGGGFIFCSAKTTHRDLICRLADAADANAMGVDYRLAPEHPFPAALDDCLSAYLSLLEDGISPQSIAIAGDSAGGGLAIALLLKIKQSDIPMPGACVTMSPWTDLAITGRSIQKNLLSDHLIPGDRLDEGAAYYLNGHDPMDPLASPLYGDTSGLPPQLIQVSDTEVLLDDACRMAERFKQDGVPVVLDQWHALPHVWQCMAMLIPEGRKAIKTAGTFLKGHLYEQTTENA